MHRSVIWLGSCALVVGVVVAFANPRDGRTIAPRDTRPTEARDPWIAMYFEWFNATAQGKVPAGWAVAETNGLGKTATWAVAHAEERERPEAFVRCQTANQGQTYNMLLTDAVFPGDFTMSVKLRADAGTEDQGGGLVWHARNADNYMITRWNPLENNLRIYRVSEGVRTQLHSIAFDADADAWHDVKVTVRQGITTVAFDGNRVSLRLEGPEVEAPGKVGFWTKADASTSFAEFSLKAFE